jgi:hypothetical protein
MLCDIVGKRTQIQMIFIKKCFPFTVGSVRNFSQKLSKVADDARPGTEVT